MKKRSTALDHDLPFEELHPVAEQESWRKEVNRPCYHLHKWWANRLGSVFRTILLAGTLPPDADVWGEFYRPHDFRDRVVLDPFMGSGTTIGEALKLGYRVVGCDINPVAYFQVCKALEPCDPATLKAAFKRLEKRVASKIGAYYRTKYQGRDADILYTFWVKLIDCPECERPSRLFNSWIFSTNAYPSRKPESKALCPKCGDVLDVLYSDTTATCSGCRHTFDPQVGPAERQCFTCEHCGTRHRILETAKRSGEPLRHEMYALMVLLADGTKVYKRIDEFDRAQYEKASRELARCGSPIPEVEIPPGLNTDQARGYNYRFWHQMFNDRQLRVLKILLEGISLEENRAARELLLLLFSGTLEFNNMFCSFKGEGTGAVRHIFSHHILKPERTPLEAQPWGTPKSSGSFSTLFERRLLRGLEYCSDPFELRVIDGKSEKIRGINQPMAPRLAATFSDVKEGRADALLLSGDSSRLPVPDSSVDLVVTDPPYFDNVNYSELADFFYVWLRHGLQGSDPAFGPATTRSPKEVQAKEATDFERLLGGVLKEAARVLKPDGLVAFTFHHARPEAWTAVSQAISQAGLSVVAAHPVKEGMSVAVPKMQAQEPISLDLVIVCRHSAGSKRRAPALGELLRQAGAVVERFGRMKVRLSRGDIRVILMGEALKLGSGLSAEAIVGFTSHVQSLWESQSQADQPRQDVGKGNSPVAKGASSHRRRGKRGVAAAAAQMGFGWEN